MSIIRPVVSLVVEHDHDTRDALHCLLETTGYTVVSAASGLAALDLLRAQAHRFVVLLDWKMPYLDGFQVLKALTTPTASLPAAPADAHDAPDRPGLALAHPTQLSHLSQPTQHVYSLVTASHDEAREQAGELPKAHDLTILEKPFDNERLLHAVAAAAVRLRESR
jgi:CheY-like chemotaxis protein